MISMLITPGSVNVSAFIYLSVRKVIPEYLFPGIPIVGTLGAIHPFNAGKNIIIIIIVIPDDLVNPPVHVTLHHVLQEFLEVFPLNIEDVLLLQVLYFNFNLSFM